MFLYKTHFYDLYNPFISSMQAEYMPGNPNSLSPAITLLMPLPCKEAILLIESEVFQMCCLQLNLSWQQALQ